VWKRTANGKVLHFYLAGINNQNFLMRDRETGTWWQQISGQAIYGPMKGAQLELVLSDELTFGEWKSEVGDGKVLAPVAKYVKEYESDWEPKTGKYPVPISFPGTVLKSRDVIVGLTLGGASRAYPWDTLLKQSPVIDHVAGTPLLVAIGPDGKSFRVFVSRIDGKDAEFFLKAEPESEAPATAQVTPPAGDPKAADPKTANAKTADEKTSETNSPSAKPADTKPADTKSAEAKPAAATTPAPPIVPKPWILLDTATASEWNFQGCAVSGPAQGKCLDRVPALKDYWFDWRNYHHDTTVYKH
jgi:hypothetical protein